MIHRQQISCPVSVARATTTTKGEASRVPCSRRERARGTKIAHFDHGVDGESGRWRRRRGRRLDLQPERTQRPSRHLDQQPECTQCPSRRLDLHDSPSGPCLDPVPITAPRPAARADARRPPMTPPGMASRGPPPEPSLHTAAPISAAVVLGRNYHTMLPYFSPHHELQAHHGHVALLNLPRAVPAW